MRYFRVYIARSNDVFLNKVESALTLWERFRGLMLRSHLTLGEGILIPDCRSVHTCFMRFPIDVVYLTRDNEVVKIVPRMKPWRVSACMAGCLVLEAPAGWAARVGLQEGDRVRFEFVDGWEAVAEKQGTGAA
jgi:uncharacterized membrane protein (UPF0127 family)